MPPSGRVRHSEHGNAGRGNDGAPREEHRTRNEHYNLVSVPYHALQGAENCDTYALDALEAGRDDPATFFRESNTHLLTESRERGRRKGVGCVSSAPEELKNQSVCCTPVPRKPLSATCDAERRTPEYPSL